MIEPEWPKLARVQQTLLGALGSLEREPRYRAGALLLLAVIAFAVGARIWSLNGARGFFYQEEFGTAVSVACGRGFQNVYSERHGFIRDFLASKRPGLTCTEAFSAANTPELGPPNLLQHQTISLQYAFAGLWRLFGFSWNVAALLTGLMLAMTAAATYGLARQLVGVAPALATAALAAAAVDQLGRFLIDIRDFSKAPFVLALAVLSLELIFARGQAVIPLAAAAGLLTAVGTGFRTDVSVFLVLVPLAIALGLHKWQDWRWTVAGLVAFAVVVVGFDLFVLKFSIGLGRNNPHFVILGQTSEFMKNLGIEQVHQGALSFYNDLYAHQIVTVHAASMGAPPPPYESIDYDRAGRSFLVDLLLTFPANEMMMGMTAAYRSLFGFLGRSHLAALSALLLTATVIALRFHWRGLALVATAVLLGGITGAQFDTRHIFHLRLVGLVMLVAFAATAIVDLSAVLARRARITEAAAGRLRHLLVPQAREPKRKFAVALLICLAILLSALFAARLYQSQRVDAVLRQIESFPRTALPVVEEAGKGTATSMRRFDATMFAGTGYGAITLSPASRCANFPRVDVSYEGSDAFHDWSFRLKSPPGEISAAYFPVPVVKGYNRVASITAAGIEPGCEVQAWSLAPDRPFLPLVYFTGRHAAPSYHESPITEGMRGPLRRLLQWMRPRECLLQKVRVNGGDAPALFERPVTVPSFITITVDPGTQGHYSGHLDIGDPRIVLADRTVGLSQLPFAESKTQIFPINRDANTLGNPLRIGQQSFVFGIGLHAPARATIELPPSIRGKLGTLRFHYGIDDQTEGRGGIALSVCLVK
jgi:hypothetical protein